MSCSSKCFRACVHTVVVGPRPVAKMACSTLAVSFRFLRPTRSKSSPKNRATSFDPSLADSVRNGREVCFRRFGRRRLAAFGATRLGYVPPDQASGAANVVSADVAYMSYGFTHPDFRAASLHGYIMGLQLQELAKRDVTKLVSIVAGRIWPRSKAVGGWVTSTWETCSRSAESTARSVLSSAAKKLGVRFGRHASGSCSFVDAISRLRSRIYVW